MVVEVWDLWFPGAGATGMAFGRARIDSDEASDGVFVHAAPPELDVTVMDDDGAVRAHGKGLRRQRQGPMSFLHRRAGDIALEDLWPGPEDEGRLVILPGGEAGRLVSWWNAPDQSEWRWRLELYNHR